MVIMGEAGAYVGVGVCGKSLYLLLSFAVNLKLLQKNKVSFKKVILIKQLIQRHWFFLFSLLMFPQASCLGNTHPMSLLLSSQLSFYYKPGDSWSAAKITKGDTLAQETCRGEG